MSREIKFRAWADYGDGSGEMLPNVQNHINGDWAFGNILMNNVEGTNFTVMQFTGLKDKNGVEVYEGDVVKVDDDGDCYLSDVYFDGGALCISVEHCDFDYTAIGWAIGSQCGIESIEVIGNIHENPDLLKELEKMDYEDMSDFEINKEVGKLTSPDGRIYTENDFVYLNPYDDKSFNPCNNPSDAWPIIIENKISVSPQCTGDDFWSASRIDTSVVSWSNPQSQFFTRDKNPLRAAMICFLKMKDAEK